MIYKQGVAGATAKFFRSMEKAGLMPNVKVRCETVEGVKSTVRAGRVLGMLYRDNLASEIERGEVELVRVAGCDLRIESTIVYSRRRPLSPAAEALLDLLRRAGAQAALRHAPCPAATKAGSLAALWLSAAFYTVVDQAVDAAVLFSAALV